jgi:glycosyltransferase involved in cell wall biosynthesis
MPAQELQVMEIPQASERPRHAGPGPARKKILFVIHSAQYGGLEKHVLYLVRRLLGSGAEISIFNQGPDFFTSHLEGTEHAEVHVASNDADMSFWDWFRLFRSAKPDITVLSFGWIGSFPFVSIAAWLAGVRRRIAIQQFLSPPPPQVEGNSLANRLRRRVGGRERRLAGYRVASWFFHRTICVSNAVRDSLVRDYGFSAKNMTTIYNCVSVSQFQPSASARAALRAKLHIGPDEFLLICSARLSEVKRVDILIDAIARLTREGIRYKCVIVGDGPLKDQLMAQTQELGLSGQVFFEGFQQDVRPYLQAGSAFVLASRAEGLPLAIVEAMACGLPCIVTDVGGNAEAVAHKISGLVVPSGSVEGIAAAISFLVANPQECAQMSRMARARACEIFDIEKSMAATERVILDGYARG